MTHYQSYLSGETEQVYQAIQDLRQDAFLPEKLSDVEMVLTETFRRVAYNLDIIYAELKSKNYHFKTEFNTNSDRPIMKPLADTEKLLEELDNAVRPYGLVPLSLKIFYRVVGACNFSWDYETNDENIWQYADPIQIFSLDDLVSEITDQDFLINLDEIYEEDGFVSLPLSPDYYHKDNTSGGPAYSLLITPELSIDAPFINEEHNTTFINYLRICFENCGFPRIKNPENRNEYQTFLDRVKPKLKPI